MNHVEAPIGCTCDASRHLFYFYANRNLWSTVYLFFFSTPSLFPLFPPSLGLLSGYNRCFIGLSSFISSLPPLRERRIKKGLQWPSRSRSSLAASLSRS